MKERVIVNPERCKQCGLCVSVCPKQAIRFGENMNKAGYKHVVVDHEKCIACGMCYTTCPDGVYRVLGDK